MGIHDREYIRDDSPPSLWADKPVVTKLLVINGVLFLANILIGGDDWLTYKLAMTPETLTSPLMWFQFLTSGFVHSPSTIWHILGNMFLLFMFGRPVETVYGRREFLTFYLTAIILGSVFWTVRQAAMGPQASYCLGASGGVVAVLLLFVFHFPKQTVLLFMVIPVPAWLFGLIIVGSDIQLAFQPGTHVAFDVHLIGATFAACYYYGHWRLSSLIDRFPWPSRGRPKLRIRSAADDVDPPPPRPKKADVALESEADRILDKLHREGQGSLTARERKTLENYSRRMRKRRQ
ncbi:MAG: rhomboid family intramembrane serine protease [Pirellulaceae bacterium]